MYYLHRRFHYHSNKNLFITLIIIILCHLNIVYSQECSSLLTCHDCITKPNCAWCASKEFDYGFIKCETVNKLKQYGCPSDLIVNPVNKITLIKHENQSEQQQLTPKVIKLQLRINETAKFNITYRQPLDFPVDLYYLMDLTYSMKAHQEKLVELADRLTASMANITRNFRLGFGSFIDKVVMPYANMVPSKLKNPCSDALFCAPPYGFRNHLSLTSNSSKFLNEIKAANLSANLDNAEGGFDAIMQVIVCYNEIKWNDFSRKIILFATDAIFHYAGDGKLGGIVKPNDGKCHLDANGYYTESTTQDYPSLYQINRAVIENKIHIIYSVPHDALKEYIELSKLIEGSVAGGLSEDSSNIVDLIQDNYEKIVSRIEFYDNSSNSIELKYFSNCLNTDKPMHMTKFCDGIRFGQTVNFEIEVKATSCLPNGKIEKFFISPFGIKDNMLVEVNVTCECDCEKNIEFNSTSCSNFGHLICGVCDCELNRYGKACECVGEDSVSQTKIKQCLRHENATNYCSNRGECLCGRCECKDPPTKDDKIYGKFCECDTFTCAKDDSGQLCGGHGECCDNKCICNEGWSGFACECPLSTESCINPKNNRSKICSGNGECICGTCQCNRFNNSIQYTGTYCEECMSCQGKCTDLVPCVECKVFNYFNQGSYNEQTCEEMCRSVDLKIVDEIDENNKLENEKFCIYFDKSDCQITYKYFYDFDRNILSVNVRKERDCRDAINLWIIIATIAGIVFFIGLICLLICRLLVYIKDRNEYLQYVTNIEKDKIALQTRELNPLYREPETKYSNPIYRRAN